MDSRQPDHNTFREWLYLEPDGEMTAGESSRLQQHLTGCPECRDERQELLALTRLLEDSRISAGIDFRDEVMAGLPRAGWQTSSPRSWVAAVAAVVLLGLGAALLVGAGSQEVLSALPLAAMAAVWELFSSSAVAGAGLLTASWKGLGIAFQEVLGSSLLNMIAFGVVVLGLDLLLLRLLLRRRAVGVAADDRHD